MLVKMENGVPQGGEFKASSKPVIIKFSEDYYDLDPTLRYLRQAMIKDTSNNREFAFWNDSLSQTMTEITAAVIVGDGPIFEMDDKESLQIIEDFCEEINVQGRSIEDWMRSVWFDAIIHARSFWRIAYDPRKYKQRIDIQRIDPKTLRKWRDPHEGWTAWIQGVIQYKTHRSKAQFYRNALNDERYANNIGTGTQDIVIPDEPNVLLRTSFFIKPPISSIISDITNKRWTKFFMKKFAQKHWAPWIIAMVGDPTTNYYPDDEEMEETLTKVQTVLPKISNWGGVALPGIVKLVPLETGSNKTSQIYKDAIDIYNKEIMLGLFASMALRDASGVELSTQRNLLEEWYEFVEGIRRKFRRAMQRFFVKALLPAWGKDGHKPRDVRISFTPIKRKNYLEIAQAIERLNNAGIWKDDNEARFAASIIFEHITQLDAKENKKRGQAMIQLGGGGLFGGSRMGSQRNPQAKRSSVTKAESEGLSYLKRIMEHIESEK